MTKIDNDVIIDHYINKLNETKWQITFRAHNGIQIKKLKHVNRLGIWSGLFLLPFWGVGVVIWGLVVLDYLFQQETIHFITTDKMVKQLKKAE